MVSMLQIAENLSISAGNLSYHYKNKAVLLNIIYKDIHEESIDFIHLDDTYITLHHFEIILIKYAQIQKKYTFFFNELVHIARLYPSIIKQYEKANIKRFKESRKIIEYYISTERIIAETATVDYDKLIYSIFMISTFWQSQKQVIKDPNFITNKCPSINILWSLLIPYLTKQGMQEYKQIKQFVNKTI